MSALPICRAATTRWWERTRSFPVASSSGWLLPAIQRAITELVAGRTLVVIAHRLHTITGADRILMLENGEVTEAGTHEELVAAGKGYATMWARYQTAQAGIQGEEK